MVRKILLSALLALVPLVASAQQAVRQSGNVTPRHMACWTSVGVVQDCGTAAVPFATSLGAVGEGPTICARSSAGSDYNLLCMAANTGSAAQISLQNFGGASAQALQFNINGNIVTLPSAGGNFVTYSGSPLVGNPACWNTTTGQLVNCSRITNAQLATVGAATLKGNPSVAQADVQDFTIQGLTQKNAPDANTDFVIVYDASAGTLKKATPGSIASSATAGVSSLNGLTGGLTLGALTVTATGASSAVSEANRAARQMYITDFGAVCDGTTNDVTAINATVTAVASAGGGLVNVPAATCAIASSINLVQGVTLNGQGAIIDQLGFSQPATAASKIKWIGGVTGAMISTPAALNSNIGITNLTLDGRLSSGSLPTSALKGIKLGSGFGAKIQDVVIANIGHGISLEPGYGASSPELISWGDYRNITMTNVGTGIDFSPNALIGQATGGVTNNRFYNITVYEPRNYGLNFWSRSDDNLFHGVFLDSSTVGSTLVAFNTLDPTNSAGVYSNSIVNAEISCNDVGPGTNIHPIVVNNTSTFGTYIQGQLFNCEAPTVNAGGIVTIIDDVNPNYVWTSWRPINGFAGLSLQNPNVGASATSGIYFGNNASNGIAHIVANSGTNTAFAGTNSLNIINDSVFPIGFGINGNLMGQFTVNGFEVNGTVVFSNQIGNGNGSNPLCWNSGTGRVTFATTACTASDASLKRDFVPIKDALGLIQNIDGGYFYWKDPTRGAGRQIGLIANTAEKTLPELVSKDGTGMRGFDYQHLGAVLLQSIKELKADNDNLRADVAKLGKRFRHREARSERRQ